MLNDILPPQKRETADEIDRSSEKYKLTKRTQEEI